MACSGLDCAFGPAWPFQHGGEAPDQIAHDARLGPRRAVGEMLVIGRVADKADIVFPGVKLLHGVQPPSSIDGATLFQAMGIDG